MRTVVFVLGFALLAALWWSERISGSRLQVEIQARTREAHEAAMVLRERDRLRALQPSATELASLRRAASEHARLRAAIAAQAATGTRPAAKLELGDWRPASSWRNCGQATPTAAVETALWAAAGGDIATLKNLFSIGDDTRRSAEALLDRLPPDARARYATVEDLIAELTVKNVPLGSAQLVWFNQTSDDAAAACLFLQKTDSATPGVGPMPETGDLATPTVASEAPSPRRLVIPAAAPDPAADAMRREAAIARAAKMQAERAARPGVPPPSGPDNSHGTETYLSLERDGDAWRLIVPPSAINSFAKQLNLPPTS